MRGRICIAALAVALAGCSSYHKDWFGTGYGYGDRRIGDSMYSVYFKGDEKTSRARVHMFWLYRCAALTLEQGFPLMLLGDGEQLGLGGGPAVAPLPEYPDQPPGTTLIWTAGGSVTMMREPLPDALVFALDARRIAGELKPYVDGPKDDTLPDLDALFRDALVAHETVTVSLDVAEGPELVASNSEPPRDLAEVRATLESWGVVLGLHVLYVAHVQSSGQAPSGQVDVAFRVLPSGNVADCRVVSATLTAKELVDGVCRLVSAVRFDEEQVAELEVRSFSVAFAPALSPAEEERARELPL